jgi:hypothetical protein
MIDMRLASPFSLSVLINVEYHKLTITAGSGKTAGYGNSLILAVNKELYGHYEGHPDIVGIVVWPGRPHAQGTASILSESGQIIQRKGITGLQSRHKSCELTSLPPRLDA